MPNSNFITTVQKGFALAAGLLFANAVVMPLISNRTPWDGLGVGVIAGVLALIIYTLVAIARSRGDTK